VDDGPTTEYGQPQFRRKSHIAGGENDAIDAIDDDAIDAIDAIWSRRCR
jgi:hypothetical protein